MFQDAPVWKFLSGAFAICLQRRELFLCDLEGNPASIKPLFAVYRHFLRLARILSKDVLYCVDQEAAGSASWVVDCVAKIGIEHLNHHRADLPRRPELPIECGLAEMCE